MKKFFSLILVLALLFGFASCKKDEELPNETQAGNNIPAEEIIPTSADEENKTTGTTATTENNSTETTEKVTENKTKHDKTTVAATAPAKWSKEDIIDFYKKAAAKSKTAAKSKQVMTMESLVVNDGDGFIGKMIEFATPIFKSALKNSSTEFDGITGGYEKLAVSDTQSIRAYKSGSYTVVEMTMKEQTDGIHGDSDSGTVGHAISVVGDISVVADALPQFNIDFENADLKLHYSDPTVKVKINKNGIIEKGTWSYTVNITSKNLYIAAKKMPFEVTIGSSYGSVGYIITVGGGF